MAAEEGTAPDGERRTGAVQAAVLPLAAAGLAAGLVARLLDAPAVADAAWLAAVAVVLVPLTIDVAVALRQRRTGVDVIAWLAMTGAILLGETLAGAVIALMLAGGQALERRAGARARRELSALLARAPRTAHRRRVGGLETVPAGDVVAGELLVVKPGEVVPVDGVVAAVPAVLDESALTGESVPADHVAGEQVRSGAVNAGGPFELRATAAAADSTYAGIVRMVREAQASKAPFVRLADRFAAWFLPLTLVVAGAGWALSGDPRRALAVLVVATPCPLLLAAPIAVTAGVSRAASRGAVVKGGAALEALARASIVLLDKTGTLTRGRPEVAEVEPLAGQATDQVLRLAASLDQVSTHPFAASIVAAAARRGLGLSFPTDVAETPGLGTEGTVDGLRVRLGQVEWAMGGRPVPAPVRSLRRRAALEGSSVVALAVDGEPAGGLLLDDPLRPDAARALRTLRREGIRRVDMVSGDRADIAELVGAVVGADRVLAERSPADKVEAVRAARAEAPTVMVGDGINDAPALAAADVGVAMGARGATASSEAADVVLVVDRIDRLPEVFALARRAQGIAMQSVVVGMGLSGAAMAVAAAGLLAPVAGALVQEAIDVAVILNALRALRGGGDRSARRLDAPATRALVRFAAEHADLRPGIAGLRRTADRLEGLSPAALHTELAGHLAFLADRLLPHERAEEDVALAVLSDGLGDEDPTAPLSHTHREIERLTRLLRHLAADLSADAPDAEDRVELRRLLYGLHAVVRLHLDQEDELYERLLGDTAGRPAEAAHATAWAAPGGAGP